MSKQEARPDETHRSFVWIRACRRRSLFREKAFLHLRQVQACIFLTTFVVELDDFDVPAMRVRGLISSSDEAASSTSSLTSVNCCVDKGLGGRGEGRISTTG